VLGSHKLSDGSTAYSSVALGNKLGVQFHPEVFDDTPEGFEVFRNFLLDIAKLQEDQAFQEKRLKEIIRTKTKQIAQQVGDNHVIAFVSGGIDSSVAVTLAAKVIMPEKLHAFYIDHGFMRDEDELVIEALQAADIPVQKIDAALEFEKAAVEIDGKEHGPLVVTTDPEIKRKIIGYFCKARTRPTGSKVGTALAIVTP
jgi:GMP synthase (glutamine-hydrolysing)